MVSFTTVLLLLVATISSSAPPPSPPPSANWTTTKDLVSLLQRIESDSSNDVTPLTSRQLVTSLRKLSYDSSYWNSLIPEVASTPTKLEASSNVPSDAIQRLSRGNNNLVDSSTGKSLDVNHLWAAMDVILNPKLSMEVHLLGVTDSTTIATWGGDLGSAVAKKKYDDERAAENSLSAADRFGGCQSLLCYLLILSDEPVRFFFSFSFLNNKTKHTILSSQAL